MLVSPSLSHTLPNKEDDLSRTLVLPDGRKPGYTKFGPKAGKSVILLYSLACSRLHEA